jgi:diguanylate cyclase (GGDEF)-like protein
MVMRLRERGRNLARVFVLIACSLLSLAAELQAQRRNVRFQHFSTDDGLSQATINCILQDRRGFLWVGTEDGLNRYDGYGFTSFKNDDLDSSSLSNNHVSALLEDSQGNLWIGTFGGLNRWNPARESFDHVDGGPAGSDSLKLDRITTLYQDRRGRIWIGTDGGGLARLDVLSSPFLRYTHDPPAAQGLSSNRIVAIEEDRHGMLWIGTRDQGLDRLDPETGSVRNFRHRPDDPLSLSDDWIATVFEDSRDELWIGTREGGVNRFDPETATAQRYQHDPLESTSVSANYVRVIFEDRKGILWVGTDSGLNEFDRDRASFIRYTSDSSDPRNLVDDDIRSLYQDRGGVLWVGAGSALHKWNTRSDVFSHYREEPNAKGGLSDNRVISIQEAKDGSVWVGTYGGGLNRLDPRSGRFTQYRHRPSDPRSLSDDRATCLLVTRNDTLWVGTFAAGLNRFDGKGGFVHFKHDPGDPSSLSTNGVMALFEDRDRTLWVGTYEGGLERFDGKTFLHLRHDPANPRSMSNDRVQALYQETDGTLWIGTDGGGLNRHQPGTNEFVAYRHSPGDATSLTSNSVYAIAEDGDGTLWVATDRGLNKWPRSLRKRGIGQFSRYKERNGLPNELIYGILVDDDGFLWMSTNNGLSRFDPRNESFANFGPAQGLQASEFNFGAYHKGASGRMYFGGVNGFNAFFPARVEERPHIPPVLTAFYKLNEKVVLERPIWEIDEVEIGYRDDVLSFEFAALDFSAPEQNRYAYKLEGFDDDWIELGTGRRATYTSLESGRYTLRVRGSNSEGVWNEDGVVLGLHVLPAPWETWWAYTLYVIAGLNLFIAYIRFQARKLEREAEYSRKLERTVQERTKELAEKNEALGDANEKLKQAVLTDSLTGLLNRRYLVNELFSDLAFVDRQLKSAEAPPSDRPTPKSNLLFTMIDLDGLKRINDVQGHLAGDGVIVQMCQLLKATCRASDKIIRWGGDEFLVIARNMDAYGAETLAEKLRRAVAEHNFDLVGGSEVRLSCSVGFAFYPFFPEKPGLVSGEQVLSIADRALYLGKASGRNAWVGIYSNGGATLPNLLERIQDELDALVREGVVEIRASFADPERMVWKHA